MTCHGEICDSIANNIIDVVKLKLFFSDFFTNQDSEGFKHFGEIKNLLCLLEKYCG